MKGIKIFIFLYSKIYKTDQRVFSFLYRAKIDSTDLQITNSQTLMRQTLIHCRFLNFNYRLYT